MFNVGILAAFPPETCRPRVLDYCSVHARTTPRPWTELPSELYATACFPVPSAEEIRTTTIRVPFLVRRLSTVVSVFVFTKIKLPRFTAIYNYYWTL